MEPLRGVRVPFKGKEGVRANTNRNELEVDNDVRSAIHCMLECLELLILSFALMSKRRTVVSWKYAIERGSVSHWYLPSLRNTLLVL